MENCVVNIGNDKAIEFNDTYMTTIRSILNLKGIYGDWEVVYQKAMKIKKDCDEQALICSSKKDIDESIKKATREQIYINGISDLKDIQRELERFDVYLRTYEESKNIERRLNDSENLNENQVKSLAENIIRLIIQLHNSATELYSEEEIVVEKVYNLAYKVIKAELVFFKKSTVLDFVKANNIAEGYLNQAVLNDIELLDKEFLENRILQELLQEIRGQGVVASYLNEGLILYLALHGDSKNIQKIEAELTELYEIIQENYRKIKECSSGCTKANDIISDSNRKLEKTKIFKNIALIASYVGLFSSILAGTIKCLPQLKCVRIYRVRPEIYSTSDVIQTPKFPEYMDVVPHPIEIFTYEPWQIIDDEAYEREVTSYYVSKEKKNYELNDYLNMSWWSSLRTTTSETSNTEVSSNPSYFYDEDIMEVIRFNQDLEDYTYRSINKDAQTAILLMVLFFCLILGVSLSATQIKKIKDKFKDKEFFNSEINRWQEYMQEWQQEYEELYTKNESYRKNFINMYESYMQYIQNEKLKDAYMRLTREKNEK